MTFDSQKRCFVKEATTVTRPLVFRYAPNSLNLFYAFDGNKTSRTFSTSLRPTGSVRTTTTRSLALRPACAFLE